MMESVKACFLLEMGMTINFLKHFTNPPLKFITPRQCSCLLLVFVCLFFQQTQRQFSQCVPNCPVCRLALSQSGDGMVFLCVAFCMHPSYSVSPGSLLGSARLMGSQHKGRHNSEQCPCSPSQRRSALWFSGHCLSSIAKDLPTAKSASVTSVLSLAPKRKRPPCTQY